MPLDSSSAGAVEGTCHGGEQVFILEQYGLVEVYMPGMIMQSSLAQHR